MISKDSSHKRTSGSLFLSVTSWTSRGGDPVSDHHLMTAGPLKVSPLMGEETSANSPAVDIWTICRIIC